jgi:hypothetical protein
MLAAPASASKIHHVPVIVKNLITPTKTNPLRSELLVVKPNVSIGDPGVSGECAIDQDTTFGNKIMIGKAWVISCTGDETETCKTQATLQVYDKYLGLWEAVDSGVTTDGCSYAERSVASAGCTSTTTFYDYRTQGIYTILWGDGDVSGPVAFPGGEIEENFICS